MRDSFQQRHLDNSTRSKLFLATDKWPRYLQLAGSYITWEYIVKCTFGIVYVPFEVFLENILDGSCFELLHACE